jgi:hypothetical protein
MITPVAIHKSKWGPALWTVLHVCSVACEDYEAFSALLLNLQRSLPCPECREHYTAYLANHPPIFQTKEECARFVFDLHNSVNARLHKPFFSPAAFFQKYQVVVGTKPPDIRDSIAL